jgi:hypothetical protein
MHMCFGLLHAKQQQLHQNLIGHSLPCLQLRVRLKPQGHELWH